uniref:RBBP8 N-terminal like n=1 Tax=Otus sunia TaxID=257818 RepID=A0A8C8EA59_9STRI
EVTPLPFQTSQALSRAGLCDRCMVTQELAKKKQNEYESSHFQSLKHIFILSTYHPEQLTWTFSPLPQASQRVANQLHGTIALVRPGSRPCFLEKCPLGAAVSPPARKTPLPPEHEHSPSLEAKPDSPKVAPSYENLKLTTRREQLCLLHKHLSLHQLGLASNCASADRDGSSFSSHLLRTKDADSRTRSRDSWEDRATLLKLPAAMVYVRDQQLEEKLHLLKHRERLQHFLMQRCQPGQRADGDPKPLPEERPLSPWPNITAGCKEERSFLEDAADGKEEKELWLSRDSSELQEKVKATRDDGADAPLDLSDSGRGRETGWHSRREPWGASSPQPSPGESPAGSAAHGPSKRHEAERDNLRFPYCWPNATRALPGAVEEEEEEEDAAVVSTVHVGINHGPFPTPRWPAGTIMTTINDPWEDGFAACEASGDTFRHGKATAAQPWLLLPISPPFQHPWGFHPGPRTSVQQRLCPIPQVGAGGVLSSPATHHQCIERPLRCSFPWVSQSSCRGWGQPFPPAWQRQYFCSLFPTAHALTGTSDKQLHAERPRGPSRDWGETGYQCTEGRSR